MCRQFLLLGSRRLSIWRWKSHRSRRQENLCVVAFRCQTAHESSRSHSSCHRDGLQTRLVRDPDAGSVQCRNEPNTCDCRRSFVPVEWERYDLIIPRKHFESALLEPLLALLHDAAFRAAVGALPGYDPTPMGHTVAETG